MGIERSASHGLCQVQCVPDISEGNADIGRISFRKQIKLWLKRNLSTTMKKKLKGSINRLINIVSPQAVGNKKTIAMQSLHPNYHFQPGEIVQVRSRPEIEETLDHWRELKGCMFMEDMWQYCGTVQRVLKSVEKFVDERDYRLKKTRGLVLLDGLLCQGTPDYGRCDRACFYFWREEWLEKIEEVQNE